MVPNRQSGKNYAWWIFEPLDMDIFLWTIMDIYNGI
jgi:hypothetical protein